MNRITTFPPKSYEFHLGRSLLFLLLLFATGAFAPRVRAETPQAPLFEFSTRRALDAWMILGPFDESSDEISANELPGVFGAPGSPALNTGRLVWRDERPFRWFSAWTNARGFLEVHSLFGPSKLSTVPLTPKAEGKDGAKVLYLYRQIKVAKDTRASLALMGSGGASAWLNAEPLGGDLGEVEAALAASQGSVAPIEGVTLRRGLNHLVVKTRLPSQRTPWVVYAHFLEPGSQASIPTSPNLQIPFRETLSRQKSKMPDGWRVRAAALPDKKAKPLSYALYLPLQAPTPESKATEKTKPPPRPLAIIAAPSQTDEFHVLLYEPALVVEAQRAGWALAVLDLTTAAMREISLGQVLEAVRKDAAQLPEIDSKRSGLIALGDTAEPVLAEAFERPGPYAGVALIEGRWGRPYSWPPLLLGVAPRPAVFVALPKGQEKDSSGGAYPFADLEGDMEPHDGPWIRREIDAGNRGAVYREMFETFEKNPLPPNPSRVTITGHVTSSEEPADSKTSPEGIKRAWVSLKQSRNWTQPAFLSVDREALNSLNVLAENVSRFVLFFEDRADLILASHVVVQIESEVINQKMNLVGLRKPIAVEFTLTRREDLSALWKASEWEVKPLRKSENTIAHFYEDLPLLRNEEHGGAESLPARALRLTSGAQIALIPAGEVRSGGKKGGIVTSVALGLTPDSRLSTMSLPLSHLLEIITRDYTGAGKLVTDGLEGVVGRDDRSDANPGDSAAESVPEFPQSEGFLGAFDPYRLGAKEGGEPIFLATSFDHISSAALGAKTGFDPLVVIGGWSPLLEEIASEGLAKQAKSPKTDLAAGGQGGGAYQIHYLPFGQREALLSYLSSENIIEPFPPDIRLLPRKRAVQKKWIRTKK